MTIPLLDRQPPDDDLAWMRDAYTAFDVVRAFGQDPREALREVLGRRSSWKRRST